MAGFTITGIDIDGNFFGMTNIGSYNIESDVSEFISISVVNLESEPYDVIKMRALKLIDPFGSTVFHVTK